MNTQVTEYGKNKNLVEQLLVFLLKKPVIRALTLLNHQYKHGHIPLQTLILPPSSLVLYTSIAPPYTNSAGPSSQISVNRFSS